MLLSWTVCFFRVFLSTIAADDSTKIIAGMPVSS